MQRLEQDVDILAQSFKDNLISMINNAGMTMPPSMVYYVVKDVFQNVETSYAAYTNELRQKMAAAAESATQQESDNIEESQD